MLPDVALPGADDEPLAGRAVLELVLPVPVLLLLLLLLQPATASAPTAPARAASCQPLSRRDGYPVVPCRAIYAPSTGDGRHTATTRFCTPATSWLTRGRPRAFGGRGRICRRGGPAAASGAHH